MGGPDSSLCISCTEEDEEPVYIAVYTELAGKRLETTEKRGDQGIERTCSSMPVWLTET